MEPGVSSVLFCPVKVTARQSCVLQEELGRERAELGCSEEKALGRR